MKISIIIGLLVLGVFLTGCAVQNPGQADSKLTKESAKKITETAKDCVDTGGLKNSDGWYNPNSKTW